jgi:hypothetical protein
MWTAILRFYAELNDFLPPQRRQCDWALEFAPPAPARHLIETCGVPHTEVELILRDGALLALEDKVMTGDRLAVYPRFRSFDLGSLAAPPWSSDRPLFLADAHLGALAERLRMLGFDTRWFNDLGDAVLARIAADEQRILLTRDRQLLMRQAVQRGCYLRGESVGTQLKELVHRLGLCLELAPFSRCMRCNRELEEVAVEQVAQHLPARVRHRQRHFWRCRGCGRVYWKGSHWQAMRRQIESFCPSGEQSQ